jgi:hypothetical protein
MLPERFLVATNRLAAVDFAMTDFSLVARKCDGAVSLDDIAEPSTNVRYATDTVEEVRRQLSVTARDWWGDSGFGLL